MRTPICEVCLRSGILCPACESKLRKGEISDLEVNVARTLYTLEQKSKMFREASFERAIAADDLLIIITERGKAGLLIGKSGKIAKILSTELGKRIRIVERSENEKLMIQELILPVRLLGLNVRFLPDGKEEYRIRVSKNDADRLPIPVPIIENLLLQLTNKPMKISIE
ncbi:MAG: transcription elongation factor NusA [Euryarchaeota archaeon]|nr:transcription elongation factor NusA [Euryarchaeota archaeon]